MTRWITEAQGFTSDVRLDDPLLKFAINYRFAGPSIGCPITALYGKEEQIFSKEQVRSWCEITNESFELEEVDGPHLFIEGQTRTSIIERIVTALNA